MCTASWLYHRDSYSLFFNRDETLTRSKAEPPTIIQTERGSALLPIDPDGGGTWLGVNSIGWTYALLNYYQGSTPSGSLTSRGIIVKQALNCVTIGQLEQMLHSLVQGPFAPFSLLCFAPANLESKHKPPEQIEESHSVLLWQWTGEQMQRQRISALMTSSSRNFELTNTTRRLAATDSGITGCITQTSEATLADHLQRHRNFHRGHQPERGTRSVCMHRDEAQTVSLSEVTVASDVASYNYFDGSPCEVTTPIRKQLVLG